MKSNKNYRNEIFRNVYRLNYACMHFIHAIFITKCPHNTSNKDPKRQPFIWYFPPHFEFCHVYIGWGGRCLFYISQDMSELSGHEGGEIGCSVRIFVSRTAKLRACRCAVCDRTHKLIRVKTGWRLYLWVNTSEIWTFCWFQDFGNLQKKWENVYVCQSLEIIFVVRF